LARLIEHISATKTRYVRCIKPNENRKPRVTDHMVTMRQLGSAGIVTAINMSKNIFPNQLPYDVVWDRFHCLSQTDIDTQLEYKEKTTLLLADLFKNSERFVKGQYTTPYVCGKNKVFFRSGALTKLELDRLPIRSDHMSNLSNSVKTVVHRRKFLVMKRAVIKLQALYRFHVAQRDYKEKVKASAIVYCWMKRLLMRTKRRKLRENKASIKIQSTWRGFNPQKKFRQQKKAAAMVQRTLKKRRDRQHFHCAFAEVVEAARKQKQMKSLLHKLSSREYPNTSKDELLVECQLMISYLGEQLHLQRAKTSDVQTGMANTKRTVESLQSHNDALEAEKKASKITSSQQTKKILALEEHIKGQEVSLLDLKKSNNHLQQKQTMADENHKNECIEMRELLVSQKEELKAELIKEREKHAAEVLQLQSSMRLAKEESEKGISDLQRALEEAEELHEEDFNKMLLVIEEGKVKEEELELTNESLTTEKKDLQSELQSSKKAESDEVVALSGELEKLRGDVKAKEGTIDLLQLQIQSLQEDKTSVVDRELAIEKQDEKICCGSWNIPHFFRRCSGLSASPKFTWVGSST